MQLNYSSADDGKQSVGKLTKVFQLGKISTNEYFGNVLATVVRTDQVGWHECIANIPTSLRTDFVDFARSQLLPVDFMPNPGVVFPSSDSSEAIEAAKKQLRPRYVELLNLIEMTASSSTSP